LGSVAAHRERGEGEDADQQSCKTAHASAWSKPGAELH
jgi:hypothetical protein